MKNTTYTIGLSDGSFDKISASSASDAIQRGLLAHVGLSVFSCRSGMTQQETDDYNAIVSKKHKAIAGTIDYEIPNHEPLTHDGIAAQKRLRKEPDKTALMFSEEEMTGRLKP